jgi:hypothetical protein
MPLLARICWPLDSGGTRAATQKDTVFEATTGAVRACTRPLELAFLNLAGRPHLQPWPWSGVREDRCLDCMQGAIDRYSEGLPNFCPGFLLECISRSLPADAQRLTACLGATARGPPSVEAAPFCLIANATATAMAAILSFVGLWPCTALIVASSLFSFLPGASRVSAMIANIKMVRAIMTTATPSTATVAASASRSVTTSIVLSVRYETCMTSEETRITICQRISQIDCLVNACYYASNHILTLAGGQPRYWSKR